MFCSFAGRLKWVGLFGDQSVALYNCFLHIVVTKLTRKPSFDFFVCHNYSLELFLSHLIPDACQRELLSLEPWRDFAINRVETFDFEVSRLIRNQGRLPVVFFLVVHPVVIFLVFTKVFVPRELLQTFRAFESSLVDYSVLSIFLLKHRVNNTII